jgi:acyl-CoA reductase-like NAD-dependent aldehyde dehydrogenase
MKEYQLYIGGEWVSTSSGDIIDDINPANDRVFARVHTAGPDEVEAALSAAYAARGKWAQTSAAERENILLKAADYFEANLKDYANCLIEESGSVYIKAVGEVAGAAHILRSAAGECRRVRGGVLQPEFSGQFSTFIRQPLGVVGGIAPFNNPITLALNKLAYALAAGNTFILKPASDTPVSGALIAKSFEAAGLPKGVLSVVPGSGSVVGAALVQDERVAMIAFTGSTAVGRDIAVRAAAKFKRYTLELGGKNPLILLKDFDVKRAAKIAAYGAFFHQGQICMCTSRLIVEQDSYDAFCDEMVARAQTLKVGDPHSEDTVIGPLIRKEQCAVLDAHIKDAVSKGARLLTGGTHQGAFYQPTVLADVTPGMDVFYEESFGPMTSIVRANDEEDALRLCNDNNYGLSSALLTNDLSIAMNMAPKMEAGMVHVNDSSAMGSQIAPFGGIKNSGVGREGIGFSTDEFTEMKWITFQYQDRNYAF